jgi:hypothetical protein
MAGGRANDENAALVIIAVRESLLWSDLKIVCACEGCELGMAIKRRASARFRVEEFVE